MNRFVKNNLILLAVISLSVIVALGLLVMTIIEHAQMRNYSQQVTKLRDDIKNLVSKKPAPVDGNKPLIQEDITNYTKAAKAMERKFEDPLLPAMRKFISVVRYKNPETKQEEKVTLKKFKELFFESWNKVSDDQIAQKGIIYKQFQRNFPNWVQAMAEFRNEVSNATTEPITDQSIDEIFLGLVGVPRTMQGKPELLQQFMNGYRNKLLDLLANGKVNVSSVEATDFTFTQQDEIQSDQYPEVVRNWDIMGDIVTKIVEAQLSGLNSFHKRSINGESVGDYQVYNFTFEVEGSIENIRKLVALLDQAYMKGNRVYVVRGIFLYSKEDTAKLLFQPENPEGNDASGTIAKSENRDEEDQDRPVRGRRSRRRQMMREEEERRSEPNEEQRRKAEEERRLAEEADKRKPFHERRGYGTILVGANRDCQAQITVEYVVLKMK